MLHDVEVGPRAAPVFGAQAVRAELSLEEPDARRAARTTLTLTGCPRLVLRLTATARSPPVCASLGFDAERIAIDRLVIEDGRIALEDAGERQPRDARQTQLRWRGAGTDQPDQGRGRIRRQRPAVPLPPAPPAAVKAATRVRLTLEPTDRPLAFETDGNLTFEKNSPVYEGTASVSAACGCRARKRQGGRERSPGGSPARSRPMRVTLYSSRSRRNTVPTSGGCN